MMSATTSCIVCEQAPGTLAAFIENPQTGAKLTFRCCWKCLAAAATVEGKEKMAAAANRNAAKLGAGEQS